MRTRIRRSAIESHPHPSAATIGGKVPFDDRSGLFGCCRIAAVEPVHHRLDPRRDEHLRRIGRARRHALDLRRFVSARTSTARDPPDPVSMPPRPTPTRSRENVVARGARSPTSARCARRPIRAPAPAAARAADAPRRRSRAGRPTSILKNARQLADRLAALVHERQRLRPAATSWPSASATSRSARRPAPIRTATDRAAPARRPPRSRRCAASRNTRAPGLPSPTIAFTSAATSSCRPSSCRRSSRPCRRLVLVLLALLDDFGLGRRRRRRRRGVRRRRDFLGLRHG